MAAAALARGKASDYAATWREPSGQVEATTDPACMCWYPRRPGRLRAVDQDGSRVIRCRECPGCYTLEMRELAERLFAKYENLTSDLYYAWIAAPADDHSWRNRNFHRRPGLELEPGLFRNGRTSIALVSRRRRPLEVLRGELKLDFHIQHISLKRGRVAFHGLCAGLQVSRRVYGEQVKRFYVRGLAARERRSFTIERIPYQKGYDKRTSPRAWRQDGRALHPPEAWKLQNRDRRRVRNLLELAPNAESVRTVMELVTAVASAARIPVNEPIRKKLPPDVVRRHYAEHAARVKARENDAARAATANSQPERSEGATQVLSNIESEVNSKLLSDSDLVRAGPGGRPLWQERELRDAETRRAARPGARPLTLDEVKAWCGRMILLLKNRSK